MYNHELEAWQKIWPERPETLYLYNQGDECTDITGGWAAIRGGLTRNSTDITYSSTDERRNCMSSALPVDLSKYSALYCHYKLIKYAVLADNTASGAGSEVTGKLDVDGDIVQFASFGIFGSDGGAYLPGPGNYHDITICMDIQAVDAGYIKPISCNAVYQRMNRSITVTIDKIWLE